MLLLTLFACNGDEPGSEPPPDFNYIPDYSDACLPTESTYNDAVSVTADRVESDTFVVAKTIEICGPSSCAPCSSDPTADNYNALLNTLEEFEAWGSADTLTALSYQGVDGEDLPDLFQQALAYPLRHLLVHAPRGAGQEIALSPGLARACVMDEALGTGTCDGVEYLVGFGGLDAECDAFRNTVTGELAVSGDQVSISTSTPGADPFGFQVPLNPDLPPVSDFADLSELDDWLTTQANLTVQVEEPSLNGTASCATMTGFVSPSVLQDLVDSAQAIAPYTDASGRIPTTIAIEFAPTTVDALEEL